MEIVEKGLSHGNEQRLRLADVHNFTVERTQDRSEGSNNRSRCTCLTISSLAIANVFFTVEDLAATLYNLEHNYLDCTDDGIEQRLFLFRDV